MKRSVLFAVVITTFILGGVSVFFWQYFFPREAIVTTQYTEQSAEMWRNLAQERYDQVRQKEIEIEGLRSTIADLKSQFRTVSLTENIPFTCVELNYRKPDTELTLQQWREILSRALPDFKGWLDTVCYLEEGMVMLTYASYDGSSRQGVFLLDSQGNLLNQTSGLDVDTLGDIGAPKVVYLDSKESIVSIGGGDGGLGMAEYYQIEIPTLVYRNILSSFEESGPVSTDYTISDGVIEYVLETKLTDEQISINLLRNEKTESEEIFDRVKGIDFVNGQLKFEEGGWVFKFIDSKGNLVAKYKLNFN